MSRLFLNIAIVIPDVSLWMTSLVASGVTSRELKPVPPVVRITSTFPLSAHSSKTLWNQATNSFYSNEHLNIGIASKKIQFIHPVYPKSIFWKLCCVEWGDVSYTEVIIYMQPLPCLLYAPPKPMYDVNIHLWWNWQSLSDRIKPWRSSFIRQPFNLFWVQKHKRQTFAAIMENISNFRW